MGTTSSQPDDESVLDFCFQKQTLAQFKIELNTLFDEIWLANILFSLHESPFTQLLSYIGKICLWITISHLKVNQLARWFTRLQGQRLFAILCSQ